MLRALPYSLFFFFNDTATTEIYTLSLHDALPIFPYDASTPRPAPIAACSSDSVSSCRMMRPRPAPMAARTANSGRSEEHTSELQSRLHLVCRLLLEKKKKKIKYEPPLRSSIP